MDMFQSERAILNRLKPWGPRSLLASTSGHVKNYNKERCYLQRNVIVCTNKGLQGQIYSSDLADRSPLAFLLPCSVDRLVGLSWESTKTAMMPLTMLCWLRDSPQMLVFMRWGPFRPEWSYFVWICLLAATSNFTQGRTWLL